MRKTYQTIIIGAGIAGLIATRTLQEQGVKNILCLEKKKEIGYPLQCGEGVDTNAFDSLFGRKNYPFVRNAITNNTFVVHTGQGKTHERTISMPYYQIDRPAFEKWLAEPIHKNIRMDSPVEQVTKEKREWVVTTPQDSYRTRSIILADGCHFTIQKQIGMIQNRPALGPCILGIYNIPDTPKDTFTYHFYTDFAGYIWVFPKGDGTANVGIGSLSPDKTHTGRLQTLLDTFLENEYPQAHCIQKSAGILPLDGAIEKPSVDSLLACGDAAGFVHPFSGEGIQFALKSGMYAAETIRSFLDKNIDDCSSYNRRCQEEFGNTLLLGNKMRHAYLWALEHMPERIPQLFKIPSQKDLVALKNGKLTTKLKLAKKFFRK